MPVIQDLNGLIAAGGPTLSVGKSKEEFGDAITKGLFLEIRASEKSVPTWYLRLKGPKGNIYKRLGTLREVTLPQARKLAKQIRAEHIATKQVAEVPAVNTAEMTLKKFFVELALPHIRAQKRASSVVKDLSLFEKTKNGLSGKFGHLALSAIKRHEVERFQNDMLAEGLSRATVRHHIVLLSRLLNLAVSWELLERNPLRGMRHQALNNERTLYMTPEETRSLVDVLATDSNRPVCALIRYILNSGCRKSEAMKMRWTDCDLENKVWTIPAENSKGRRVQHLPISDVNLQLLKTLPSRGVSTFVFPNPATGLPFVTISRVWYRLRAKAGLSPEMHLHDLRACLAERLLSGGASLFLVQKLLTHQDSRTTQRYARLAPQALLDAANLASVPMRQEQPQPA